MLAVDEMQSCARCDSRPPLLWSSLSDDKLLVRFLQERNDQAFGELVSRHLPLVMGVCRRTLGNVQFGGKSLGVKQQGHLRLPEKTPLANMWRTMLDRAGVPVPENFQDSTGVIRELA
jgi:hypothetical protein